jgi:hypothetical protein
MPARGLSVAAIAAEQTPCCLIITNHQPTTKVTKLRSAYL